MFKKIEETINEYFERKAIETKEKLNQLIQEKDDKKKKEIVYDLINFSPDREVLEIFLPKLREIIQANENKNISWGLSVLILENGFVLEEAISFLLTELETMSKARRFETIVSLGKMSTIDERVVKKLIRSMNEEKSPKIRREALKALGNLKAKEAFKPVLKAINIDPSREFRTKAVSILTKIDIDKAVPELVKLRKAKNWNVRTSADLELREIAVRSYKLGRDDEEKYRTFIDLLEKEVEEDKLSKKEKEEKRSQKPRLFIGSSAEAIDVARAIQEELEKDTESTIWDQAIFDLGTYTLESLLKALEETDYGIFIFNPDDITRIRGKQYSTTRDNVIFELGLFIGRLGKKRSFILKPRGTKKFHLPSDLLGITIASYNPNRSDENLVAAVAPACNKIRKCIESYEK